ncbi:hypothetical protein FACS1894217_04900 [Clostridia bacterium]|nr:hypothetical protein FACS1894217_04900 [Clostridia bacterium]
MTFIEYVDSLVEKHGKDYNGDNDPTVQKYWEMTRLFGTVDDDWFNRFFDSDSVEMLDDKIEVLNALKDGKPPDQIPKYHAVLEKPLPPEGQICD